MPPNAGTRGNAGESARLEFDLAANRSQRLSIVTRSGRSAVRSRSSSINPAGSTEHSTGVSSLYPNQVNNNSTSPSDEAASTYARSAVNERRDSASSVASRGSRTNPQPQPEWEPTRYTCWRPPRVVRSSSISRRSRRRRGTSFSTVSSSSSSGGKSKSLARKRDKHMLQCARASDRIRHDGRVDRHLTPGMWTIPVCSGMAGRARAGESRGPIACPGHHAVLVASSRGDACCPDCLRERGHLPRGHFPSGARRGHQSGRARCLGVVRLGRRLRRTLNPDRRCSTVCPAPARPWRL